MDHITHHTSWTRKYVIIGSINLLETQEVSSEPKESIHSETKRAKSLFKTGLGGGKAIFSKNFRRLSQKATKRSFCAFFTQKYWMKNIDLHHCFIWGDMKDDPDK